MMLTTKRRSRWSLGVDPLPEAPGGEMWTHQMSPPATQPFMARLTRQSRTSKDGPPPTSLGETTRRPRPRRAAVSQPVPAKSSRKNKPPRSRSEGPQAAAARPDLEPPVTSGGRPPVGNSSAPGRRRRRDSPSLGPDARCGALPIFKLGAAPRRASTAPGRRAGYRRRWDSCRFCNTDASTASRSRAEMRPPSCRGR